MKTVLHIFGKDLRRLWLLALGTLVPLVALGWFDAQRYDYYPGLQETVLNMLVPLLWAMLLALATHEDGPAGRDHYAATRPIPPFSALAAKLLFAVVAVHVPGLVEQGAVLVVHGFSPLSHVSSLLRNQALLFAGLTLPAVALAAVTRNLMQFLLAVSAVVAGGLLATLPSHETNLPWVQADAFRRALAWAAGSTTSALVLAFAFARRVSVARTSAALGVLAAALIFAFLPLDWEARLQTVLHADPQLQKLQLRYDPAAPPYPYGNALYPNVRTVAVPFTAYGLPTGRMFSTRILSSEVRDPEGRMLNLRLPGRDYLTQLAVSGDSAVWQLFHMRIAEASPAAVTATLRSRVIMSSVVPDRRLRMNAAPGSVAVADGLSCRTWTALNVWGPQEALKVLCESPDRDLALTIVGITGPGLPQRLDQRLNASTAANRGPQLTWLSPLYRGHTFFPVVPAQILYDRWSIPADAVRSAIVTIETLRLPGYAIVEYAAAGVPLAPHILEHPAAAASARR